MDDISAISTTYTGIYLPENNVLYLKEDIENDFDLFSNSLMRKIKNLIC